MSWLQSLVSPLKKLWFRLNSAQRKSKRYWCLYVSPFCLKNIAEVSRFFQSLSTFANFKLVLWYTWTSFLSLYSPCLISHIQQHWDCCSLLIILWNILSLVTLFPAFVNFFPHILLWVSGRGIYILYEDVKSCPYEDVHVLWSILVDSHPPLPSKTEGAVHRVERIWQIWSYLHLNFLSSSSYVHRNIYEVFNHIKIFPFSFLPFLGFSSTRDFQC